MNSLWTTRSVLVETIASPLARLGLEAVRDLCEGAVALLRIGWVQDESAASRAFHRLREMASAGHEIEPNDTLRDAGTRFGRVHPPRAPNALQLAAA